MTVDDGLDLAVSLWRDNGGHARCLRFFEDGVGVVALAAMSALGAGRGSAISGRSPCRRRPRRRSGSRIRLGPQPVQVRHVACLILVAALALGD